MKTLYFTSGKKNLFKDFKTLNENNFVGTTEELILRANNNEQITFKIERTETDESQLIYISDNLNNIPSAKYKRAIRNRFDVFGEQKNTYDRLRRICQTIEAFCDEAEPVEVETPTPTQEPKQETPKIENEPAPAPKKEVEPKPQPKAKAEIEVPATSVDAIIGMAIKSQLQSAKDEVLKMTDAYLDSIGFEKHKKVIEVKRAELPPVEIDNVHEKFEDVLEVATAGGINIFLQGKPGTGKSTLPKQIAEALGLDFYQISLHAAIDPSELFGVRYADGTYYETPFYQAYKNGGVFIFDEVDNGNPNILAAMNESLSGDKVTFGNGELVAKHDDFICFGTANTWGYGATAEFVGRMPLDAATLDRFSYKVEIDYDNNLEAKICGNKAWAKVVQGYRANADKKKVKKFITPRASIAGAKMLAKGWSQKKVEDAFIFAGWTEEEIKLVRQS